MTDLDDFEEHEFDEEEIRLRQERKQREEQLAIRDRQLAAEKERLLAGYTQPSPGMSDLRKSKNSKKNDTVPEKRINKWIIILLAVTGTALLTWFLIKYGGKILMGACVILWLVVEFFIYPFKRR